MVFSRSLDGGSMIEVQEEQSSGISTDLDVNDYSLWDVAVFIWDDHDSFEHLCNAYLGYNGGQPNNYCQKHDMPLIAVVNRKRCQTQCTCRDGDES
jgi:hypothetical protein